MVTGSKHRKGLLDGFEGDAMLLCVALLLIMISVIAVSSSSSLLVTRKLTRAGIMKEQVMWGFVGAGLMLGIYKFMSIRMMKRISRLGFMASFLLLAFMLGGMLYYKITKNMPTGFIRAAKVNGAWRIIKVGSFQLHTYEVVKVAMVMYLAWAIQTFKQNAFTFHEALIKWKSSLKFLKEPPWQIFLYIVAPLGLICGMVMLGSASSALLLGFVGACTILIGGISLKEILSKSTAIVYIACIVVAGGVFILSGNSGESHTGSARIRLASMGENKEARIDQAYKEFKEAPAELKTKKYKEFEKIRDKRSQIIGAKIAVKEGIGLGKGPGRSTQKYKVPVMYGDYMFSFIIEEYGLLGAIVVMLLYGSLLARGSIIARMCETVYAKTVVAGIVILISLQATTHMLVNVDIGPMTGQTLPIISHGTFAFLVFCCALGVVLSISRLSKKQVEKLSRMAAPIVAHEDVQDRSAELDELDRLD